MSVLERLPGEMHKRLRAGRTLLSAAFEVAFDFKKSKNQKAADKSPPHICF